MYVYIQISLSDLTEFESNKSEFIDRDKYKKISKHILLSMLLNTAIGFNLIKIIDEILNMIQSDFIQYIPIIFTLNDYTGFNVLSNLLLTGNTELLDKIIGLIKKINYPIKKINCSDLDLQNFDTFLRCLLFDDISICYLIDNLIKPFYTEESIGDILLISE